MAAYIYEVVCKLSVTFRTEIVGLTVMIAGNASAVCHIVWGGIAERLEYGIWTFFLDFEHYLALRLVSAP